MQLAQYLRNACSTFCTVEYDGIYVRCMGDRYIHIYLTEGNLLLLILKTIHFQIFVRQEKKERKKLIQINKTVYQKLNNIGTY